MSNRIRKVIGSGITRHTARPHDTKPMYDEQRGSDRLAKLVAGQCVERLVARLPQNTTEVEKEFIDFAKKYASLTANGIRAYHRKRLVALYKELNELFICGNKRKAMLLVPTVKQQIEETIATLSEFAEM